MGYNLRERKNMKRVMVSSSSEDESDSSYPRRRPQTRSLQRIVNTLNSEAIDGTVQMEAANAASSSMSNVTAGRKRGRPSKKSENEEGGERQNSQVVLRKPRGTRKRKAQFSIQRTERSKNVFTPSQLHRTILSWLIDSNTVEEKETIWYMDQTHDRVVLEGKIARAGILCSCCAKVITVWEFEGHAGGDHQKPYENMIVANKRVSLLTCQIEAWNRQVAPERNGFHFIEPREGAADQHDDACMVCSDGGDLMCCDQCPSTFHHNCMDMEAVPRGAWYCPYCVCKSCGFCGGDKDELFKCFQCDKKFHKKCSQMKEIRVIDVNRPCTVTFCGQTCREIFEKLEKLVGVRNKLDDGLSWTLLRRINPDSGVYIDDLNKQTECNSKIAIAWSVMDESFTPASDRQTQINVTQSTVYNCGSNYTRINFSGFYTAVLERGDEIISAASLRIHGTRLAEMPFVATRWIYRGRGMFHKLLIAIESALCSLKVENLIIPSIHGRINKWIHSYGFNYLEDGMKKEIPYFNTLMFASAIRLQKILLRPTAKLDIATKGMEVEDHQGSKNRSTKHGCLRAGNNRVQLLGSSSARIEVDKMNSFTTKTEFDDSKKAVIDLNLEPPEEDEINN